MHKDSFVIDGKVFISEELEETGGQITIREYEKNTKEILELENLVEQIELLIKRKENEMQEEQDFMDDGPKKKTILTNLFYTFGVCFFTMMLLRSIIPNFYNIATCLVLPAIFSLFMNSISIIDYYRFQKLIKIGDNMIMKLKSDLESLRNLHHDKSLELERLNAWTKDLSGMKKIVRLKTEKERLQEIEDLLIEEKIRRSTTEENEMKRVRN